MKMTMFYRTVLYVFMIFLTVIHQFTNAQNLTSESNTLPTTTTTSRSASVNTSTDIIFTSTVSTITSVVTSNTGSTTNNSTANTIVNTSITSSATTPAKTSSVENVGPPDKSTGPGWWLLIALLITIVIVIIGGVIFYYRQQSPYRRSPDFFQWCRQCRYRFLRNWRARDDDADNIILQLEQPEITNGQWPPRISFT